VGIREREIRNLPLKQQIAAAAEQFLQPRDVIYLDGSSTALQFAKIIPALDLTVLTNAHGVIDVLKNREGVEVIATGGRFDSLNDCYGGAMASQALTRYRVKTAFFSGNGIDVQRGISESDEDQADLKAFALRFVERAVFLADSTKIGLRSTYFFADLEGIDVWITDSSASEKKLNPFRNKVRSIVVA
jgi:DeoR/GlpR family transcriptional regulator of sugar metabolism